MTLKQKILLLGAIPVLLMALVVNLSNYLVARSDLESDLVVARERAIKERKALLSSYLMLAKTAIEGSYGKPDSPEVRQQVKEILRPLRYGSDGYFFVYDYQGNTVLLPTRPEMEGKNRWQDKDTKGAFLAGLPGEEESLKYGIVGGIDHPQVDMGRVNYSKKPWTLEPTQQISYVSCHDDMCLTDRLRASIPGISEAELIRLDLLAQTAVFTSQGVPFILSGEEMLRDKKGVHNSYKSPDEVNHLDWDNLKRYPQVYSYYKNLIALKKNHPAFHLGSADKVRQHLRFLDTKPCTVAFALENLEGIDSWSNIIVVLNGNKDATTLTIPEGNYTVVACDGEINERGLETMQGGTVTVNGQSALILHR